MFRLFLIISLFALPYSCSIIHTAGYRTALEDLTGNEKKENLVLISKAEVNKHQVLVYRKDSITLKAGKNTFGIKNISNGRIYIYQFNRSNIIRRIECDSLWKVQFINYITEVY